VAIITIETHQEEESTNKNPNISTEFDISIISNHSSIISETRASSNEQAAEKPGSHRLEQGDQYEQTSILIDVERDEVNIVKHSEEDKSKVRSEFMQRFGNAANTKKKQVIPNLVESSESPPLASTLDSALSYAPRRMQQDELTQASIAASLAAVNVVTQPFVRMQTDLESKIETVLKELEMLRQSDEKIGSRLKKKASDEDGEESRVKYLESLQEKQFELMSQLISAIGRDKTNEAAAATEGKAQKKFQIVEPAVNDGQLASGFRSECLSVKKRATPKQQRQNSQTSRLETKSGSRSRSKNKSGGSNGRQSGSKSRNKSSSRSPSRSRSRSRGRSLDSCRHSFSEFQLGPNGYGCSVCDHRSKRASRSKSPKRGGSKKRNEFLEELLDTAKSPNVSGILNSNGNKSALFSDFKGLNDMFDDRPTLFDKYLVRFFFF
jgi:hypothetical protein